MLGKSANHPVHTIHLNLFKTRIYLYTVGTIYFYRYIIYIYEHSICTPMSMVDYDVCMCARARVCERMRQGDLCGKIEI
jgi:hypothetical protein